MTYMGYLTLDDSIYSVLMLFSVEMFTFSTEDVVMIVTSYTNPLFIHHISTLRSLFSIFSLFLSKIPDWCVNTIRPTSMFLF